MGNTIDQGDKGVTWIGLQRVIGAHLLEGPIAARMLRLAWPVLVVLALQTSVGVAETYFVSFLGSDALAGVALVFPLFMLMTMMSNGGIGGGVSSAVARAIGAGRKRDAEALTRHSAMVGILFGAVFTVGVWLCGPPLFQWMGGRAKPMSMPSCTRTWCFCSLCRAGSPTCSPQHSVEPRRFGFQPS